MLREAVLPSKKFCAWSKRVGWLLLLCVMVSEVFCLVNERGSNVYGVAILSDFQVMAEIVAFEWVAPHD